MLDQRPQALAGRVALGAKPAKEIVPADIAGGRAGQVVKAGQVEAANDENAVAQPGQRVRQRRNAGLVAYHGGQHVLQAGEEGLLKSRSGTSSSIPLKRVRQLAR